MKALAHESTCESYLLVKATKRDLSSTGWKKGVGICGLENRIPRLSRRTHPWRESSRAQMLSGTRTLKVSMDLELARHKEFCFSRDGAYVAVGTWELGSNSKPEVCVIRVADGNR